MGAPMAKRVVSAGFGLSVFNVHPEKVEPLVKLGARSAGSPRAAAEGRPSAAGWRGRSEASRRRLPMPPTGFTNWVPRSGSAERTTPAWYASSRAWTQRAEILSHASWSRGESCSKTMSLSTWCHPETPVAIISARDDVDEAASKAGSDAAISKQTPLPDIISYLRRLFR